MSIFLKDVVKIDDNLMVFENNKSLSTNKKQNIKEKSIAKTQEIEFSKLKDRLQKKHIAITIDDVARDYLVEKSYIPEMGARPLRREPRAPRRAQGVSAPAWAAAASAAATRRWRRAKASR